MRCVREMMVVLAAWLVGQPVSNWAQPHTSLSTSKYLIGGLDMDSYDLSYPHGATYVN